MRWVLTRMTTDSNPGMVHLFLRKTFQGVLVGVDRHGSSFVHGPDQEAVNVLMCVPGSLPFFWDSVQFRLFQCLVYPVYHRSPYYHRHSLAELASISNDQSHLVLII